jgi:hypothetical protein
MTHVLPIGRRRGGHYPLPVESSYEIRPEPSEAERAAILEALAAEEAERRRASPWSDAVLPARNGDEDEP